VCAYVFVVYFGLFDQGAHLPPLRQFLEHRSCKQVQLRAT